MKITAAANYQDVARFLKDFDVVIVPYGSSCSLYMLGSKAPETAKVIREILPWQLELRRESELSNDLLAVYELTGPMKVVLPTLELALAQIKSEKPATPSLLARVFALFKR